MSFFHNLIPFLPLFYQLPPPESLSFQFLCSQAHILAGWRFKTQLTLLSLSLMLRPTVSRPVYLGIKHPSGTYDQIFITVGKLRVCWCGALSLTRGRVCLLRLLLALASAVILGSEPLGTRDHILLSQIWDFPFRRLLRLAGSRWRYSTPPPHGYQLTLLNWTLIYNHFARTEEKTPFPTVPL
jgi:hypothetical protein